MAANAESAFTKENSRAIFAVLDDEGLWAHGENFVGGAWQVGFAGQHLGLGVVDQENVDQLQSFAEFLKGALDPVIHGVASREADAVHLVANVGLQSGLDIGEEKEIGVFVFLRNAGLKFFEDVQVGESSLRFVQVVGVGAAPAESLARSAFQAADVDVVATEDLFLLGAEVFADYSNDAHLREITGCE